MPIEIKEFVIHTVVVENSESRQGGAGMVGSGTSTGGSQNDQNRQRLIEDCVRQVLAILQRQKDR